MQLLVHLVEHLIELPLWRRLPIIEGTVMLLNFKIEVFWSEHILIPAGSFVRLVCLIFKQQLRNLTRKTGRGYDQALRVLFQSTLIHTWPQVPALCIGNR